MIQITNLELRQGSKLLLQNAHATLLPGQKAALVGVNGSGKSSLFQLLLDQLVADKGDVHRPPHWRMAHMEQEIVSTERDALNYVIDGDSILRAIEAQLADAEANEDYDRLSMLYETMDTIDGYHAPVRAKQLLQGLGFAMADIDRPVNHFSGGWRVRLNLAKALMCPADMLLLDEPTNHLDMDAMLWLEQWLQRYPGTLLLISHDRDFIDKICGAIIHIEHQQLHVYRGNYSAFERQRAEYLAQQQAMAKKQQQHMAHMEQFINRFRAKASKAKQVQSRVKAMKRMEQVLPAHVDSPFDFCFLEPNRASDPLLNFSQSHLGYEQTVVLNKVSLSIHPGSRIGLLGRNGAGKSTLLKSLAGELIPVSGERVIGANVQVGYFSQHQLDALDIHTSPIQHLQRLTADAREQDIRDFLGGFNFRGDMAVQAVEPFSGGEKARLALAIIVWQKPNLLLLDEPTNHLDLDMCHALTVALQQFSGAVVLVSHDRHLLRNTVDQLLLVHDGRVSEYSGDLDDYARWLLKEGGRVTLKSAKKANAGERHVQLRDLKKTIAQVERRLDTVNNRLNNIEKALSEQAIYEDIHRDRLQALLSEQGERNQQKNDLEQQWLMLHQRLEEEENPCSP